MRLVRLLGARAVLLAVTLVAAASCGPLPEATEGARGIATDANAVFVLSVLFVGIALAIIIGAVALDRWVRSRQELARAGTEPEPEVSEEPEEETVAGIGQTVGRVPRWLYAAYVVIPVFALLYVVNAVAIQQEFAPPEPVPDETPDVPTVTDTVEIVAAGIEFDLDRIVLPANTDVTVVLRNEDRAQHNVAIYTDETLSEEIFVGELFTGPETQEYEFAAPDPGEYYFHCDVHPSMNGVAEFVEEAEAPAPADDAPPTEVDMMAEQIEFDTDEIVLAAETEVTIVLTNEDSVPHNVAIYTDETQAEPIFEGEIFPGPDTREETFTAPAPGTYYFHCDVHPFMNGTAVFR